jgi:urease accessory protein
LIVVKEACTNEANAAPVDADAGAGNGRERFPLELAVWLSPAFPVGSFAYSHGLEWAAGTGRIHDRASAAAWLQDLIEHGGVRNDAILLTAAWRATYEEDWHALNEANELAIALAGSRERRLETTAQGNAFVTTVLAAWATATLRAAVLGLEAVAGNSTDAFPSPSRGGARGGGPGEKCCDTAYPIAVGIAAAAHDIPLTPTLSTFATAVVGNIVSALVRLSVIGQTDGQLIIAYLVPAIERLATTAVDTTLDDIGGAAFLSDVAAMAHETQDTRLFRT